MQVPKRKPGKYSVKPQDYRITQEKYDELLNKLERFKSQHPQAVKELQRLAELGDFSENAAYQMAKGRLRGLNSKIQELEEYLKKVEIIQTSSDTGRVRIGHTVTIELNGKEQTFTILGSTEANPSLGVISSSSPLGSALMSRHLGETFDIELPVGPVQCVIKNIS